MKRIEDEIDNIWVHVEKIDVGKNSRAKITLNSIYGEQAVEIEDNLARKLWLGDMLIARFTKHYSPFIILSDQNPPSDDIYTISSVLESLRIPDSNYIYNRPKHKNP